MSKGLPLITRDLPGAGGALKTVPEDFVVEELPAYVPSGEGEHLYLWVEKRGTDTAAVAKELARVGGVPEGEVGFAGMKDRQSVSRQFFSLPARTEGALAAFAMEGVTVLSRTRHGNKLRSGHLRGNRFELRLRSVKEPAALAAKLEALRTRGVPNYFGEQRFGRADDNAEKGKRLLLGERLPGRLSGFHRKLFLSAYQSELFNQLLAERIEARTFATALKGDVMKKRETGGLFVCEAPEVDQARVESFEVSPAGPMFGPKMTEAADAVGARELALLEAEGVGLEHFQRQRGEGEGTRRAYRLLLEEARCDRDGEDVVLAFALPKGSYATVVLAELTG